MAKKKPDMSNIFTRTDPESKQAQEASGPTITWGVGLRSSEWAEVEEIAGEMGTTRHGIAAYAIRYFLKQYRVGRIQPEQRPTLPDL